VLECVVNISEGRDPDLLRALRAAAGDDLLDLHADPHHHRSVLTLVGEGAPRAVTEVAVARLDLRRHTGAHPRLGVVDVVPFVAVDEPPGGAEAAADRFSRWLGTELGVPVLRYGDGGLTLPAVRRRAFRDVRPAWGPLLPHPTAGATAVGSRSVLVAYNVWLQDGDLATGRSVALAVRGPHVRAIGLALGDRVQVSMNLLDPAVVGPAAAYDAVAALAPVAGAELVGLLPSSALTGVPPERWRKLDLDADRTIEARLARRAR
jgi:glutamate formiminotransferase